jgi:hypothetical protein
MPRTLATWEAELRRMEARGQIVQEAPISNTTRSKWTADVAKAVKYLLCKGKVLSSNRRPTKIKRHV